MLSFETNAANENPKKTYENVAPISANESKIPLVEYHIPNKRRDERDENGSNQPQPGKLVLNCVHIPKRLNSVIRPHNSTLIFLWPQIVFPAFTFVQNGLAANGTPATYSPR